MATRYDYSSLLDDRTDHLILRCMILFCYQGMFCGMCRRRQLPILIQDELERLRTLIYKVIEIRVQISEMKFIKYKNVTIANYYYKYLK